MYIVYHNSITLHGFLNVTIWLHIWNACDVEFCDLIKLCTYIQTLQIATDMMLRSLPKQHCHQLATLVPVCGLSLPDTFTLHVFLRHFEAHKFWPDEEVSTLIDKPGKRYGKLFFHDSDTAHCD